MYKLATALLLATFLQTAKLQTTSDICTNAVLVDDTGYQSHGECDKYIQCRRDAFGTLFGVVRSCPFGTYWNMDLLTCVSVDQATCLNDQCGGIPNGVIRPATTNCRGYWECVGDKSVPRCCAFGQKFETTLGMCIDLADNETKCMDTCFTHIFDVPDNCDKFLIPGKPDMYRQEVDGWGSMELPCAPGTQFHPASCACLVLVDISSEVKQCKPELHLPFTANHMDKSGFRHHVTNENVDVRNGVAYFNGVNSRLLIPRFTNLEHSTTVVIKVTYSSNHSSALGMAQALVANNGCGNVPSIMMAEDNLNVYAGVGTDNTTFAFTYIDQLNKNPKQAIYKYHNGTLTISNGQSEASVPAPGFLKNVKCALQVGFASDLEPFDGAIDELNVYLCDPDQS